MLGDINPNVGLVVRGPSPGGLRAAEVAEEYDERFLVAALLVYVARGDGAISDRETQKMLSLRSIWLTQLRIAPR